MSFIGIDSIAPDAHTQVDTAKGIQPELEPLVQTLERALRMDQERFQELEAYYNGAHPHSFDSMRFQQAFGRQLRRFADNWMRMMVHATADRLSIQGFRVGNGDDTGQADDLAWRIWQANKLDAASAMAHRETMKFGTCFLLVDPFDSDGAPLPSGTPPHITVESPMQIVGQRDSQDRYRLLSAIKKWVDNDNYLRLNLYLPDVVYKYRSSSPAPRVVPGDQDGLLQQASWEQIGESDNPLGVVPIIPMENCPDLLLGGHSDLEDVIPLNDGLNKVLRDMLVTSEYQAFQQRVVIGAEIPKDPLTNKPMTDQQMQLIASQSRVWMFPDSSVKVESLPQVDLTPYTNAVDLFIHHIAMVARLPSYLLVGKLSNLSADAIRASELGFVQKLVTKQTDFGVAWESAIALALKSMGSSSSDEIVEAIWKDAAANSGSILANELVAISALEVPREVLWEKWGATPQDVERWTAINKANPPEPVEPPAQVPTGSEDGTEAASQMASSGNSAPDG
jgi:hypothetical protein